MCGSGSPRFAGRQQGDRQPLGHGALADDLGQPLGTELLVDRIDDAAARPGEVRGSSPAWSPSRFP